MRAVFLQIFLIFLPPATLFAPQIGPLAYYWYTWMNPHRLTWIALDFQWGKIIAITTLIVWIVSKKNRTLVWNYVTLSIVALYFWTIITTLFAQFPDHAFRELQDWSKIILMCIISTGLLKSRTRVHALVWILVISIGYYGVKGGIFFLSSGGNYLVLGPPGTSISATNEIARAFLMTIPLAFYLSKHSHWKIVRIAMLLTTIFLVLSLIGTNSRGALVAMVGMGFYAWLYSRRKLRIILGMMVVAAMVFAVVGTERLSGLGERFSTIDDYDEDASFQGRVYAWNYATDIAEKNPILGKGFGTFVYGLRKAAHSNYFQVLGQHGYVGLMLYLLLCMAAFVYCGTVITNAKKHTELYWARDLVFMIRCAIVGYLIGGITKNHAFFELFYVQLTILVIAGAIVKQEVEKFATEEEATEGATSTPQPVGSLQ